MGIREATTSDIPKLLDMGERFLASTPYNKFTDFDREAMTGVYSRMIAADEATILVPDDVSGFVGLVVTPLYFAPETTVCNEMFWWVDPAHRGNGIRLIDAAEKWASGKADILALSAVTELNGDRVGAFYERRGLALAETTYMKGLG
jgi:GNAT superfamily N-acetyltransferase